MCENLKPDRVRCEPCRTINLAKAGSHPKPDMQMYDKCSPTQRMDCPRVAGNIVFSLPHPYLQVLQLLFIAVF